MSEDKLWGVFFEDQGGEYLAATDESEEDATEEARRLDQLAFEKALDGFEGEGPEPTWADFDGMHYVEPVSNALAEDAREQLARGLAVKIA